MAHYHGKAGQGLTLEEHLAQARAFADGPLRLALAAGARLDDGTKRRVAERYAELTGLDADYVFASDLRVLDTRFRKRLLLDRSRIVGRYDGRAAGYDLDPVSDDETFVVDDVYLDPAYSSLVNAYLRDELGWDRVPERRGFADFDWESTEPGKGWMWWHRLTPFFQTECDIDHLGLPEPLRGNVAFTYYPAGHMLYSAKESLRKFSSDLKRFYAADAADLPSIDERPALPAPRIDW